MAGPSGAAGPYEAGDPAHDATALLAGARHLVADAQGVLEQAWGLLDEVVQLPAAAAPPELSPPALSPAPIPLAAGRPTSRARRLVIAGLGVAGVGLLTAGAMGVARSHPHQVAAGLALPNGGQPAPSPSTVPPTTTARPSRPSPTTGSSWPVPLTLSLPRFNTTSVVAGQVTVQTAGPEQGLLTAPLDYHQLGWYRHGDLGALVLDGHVGYRNQAGPLAFIGELTQGDQVVVGFPGGERSFQVTVVAKAVKGMLPQQYFSAAYNADVMLITCDYTSPYHDGHYADNVYVLAAPTS